MGYKRTGVRVPIAGEAILLDEKGIRITTLAKDISSGGIGVVTPLTPFGQIDYQVEVNTADGKHILLKATLIHKGVENSGFQTSDINTKNSQIITELIEEFQGTEKFIEQIDRHDILEQNYIDEDGNEISVTFDTDSD